MSSFEQFDFDNCAEFQTFLAHILSQYSPATSTSSSTSDNNSSSNGNTLDTKTLVEWAKKFYYQKMYRTATCDQSEKSKSSCYQFIETLSSRLEEAFDGTTQDNEEKQQNALLKLLSLMPGYIEPKYIPDDIASVPVDLKPESISASVKPWLIKKDQPCQEFNTKE